MFNRFALVLSLLLSLLVARPAAATELVMVEEQGCYYCIIWKNEIGPIYGNTPEGDFAPLRMIDIDDGAPQGMRFARKVLYTPTFILVDKGEEIGRIEGYPGEDFFWGLLKMMLEAKTDYQGTS